MHKMQRNKQILFTPGPLQVSDRVKKVFSDVNITHRDHIFADIFSELQKKLLIAFELDERYFPCIFTATGRGANEAMIIPYVLNRKPLFATNGSWGDNLVEIASYYTSKNYVLSLPHDKRINPFAIDTFLSAHKDIDTLIVVHQETRSGILNPIEHIAEVSKKHGCKLVVDAMSSIVVEETNFADLNVAMFSCSSAKGLRSFPGLGIVCGKKEEFESFAEYKKSSHYLDIYAEYKKQSVKKEVRFAESSILIAALLEAVSELLEEGIQKRRNAIHKKTDEFRDWAILKKIQFAYERGGLGYAATTFTLPSPMTYAYFANALKKYNIFLLYGDGAEGNQFQVSFLGDLKGSHIGLLKKALEEILKNA